MSRIELNGDAVMRQTNRGSTKRTAAIKDAAKPVQKKGDRTRENLMDAARRVFERKGYLDAKIGDITAEAGIASGSFYNYFDDKAQLLRALIDDFWRALPHTRQRLQGAQLDPIEHLVEAATQYWMDYAQHKGEIGGLLEAAMIEKPFTQIWRELRSEGVLMTATDISRAQRAGFAQGLNPEIAASALCCLVEFTCYDWMGRKFDATGKKFKREIMLSTLRELLARAIAYRGESPLANLAKVKRGKGGRNERRKPSRE